MNLTKLKHDDGIFEDTKLRPSNDKTVKHECGKFFWYYRIHPRSLQRLQQIQSFFDESCLTNIVLPLICMKSKISLRLLNWFVISYCKETNVMITPSRSSSSSSSTIISQHIHVYNLYRTTLKFWKRELFDAFRRGPRIYFKLANQLYSTTVAQLNYIHWVMRYRILDMVYKDWGTIQTKMTQSKKRQRDPTIPVPVPNILLFQDTVQVQL